MSRGLAGIVVAVVLSITSTGRAFAQSAESTPVFTKDVAPIFFKNCATCHRPGEVATMSLLTYAEARPWARAIKTKVVAREMPPWHADPQYGKFRNATTLTQREIDTITRWVDAGAPKGNDADLPAVPTFASGWGHPRGIPPDYTIEAPEMVLPAEGEIPITNVYTAVPFTEEKYTEATDLLPSNRAVLHHSVAYMVTLPPAARIENGRLANPEAVGRTAGMDEDEVAFTGLRQGPAVSRDRDEQVVNGDRWLSSYLPGASFMEYWPGVGDILRPGTGKYIRFSQHYTSTGKPETDQTTLALWFQKVPLTHERRYGRIGKTHIVEGKEIVPDEKTAGGGNRGLPNIPPYASNWAITAIEPVVEDITIYAMRPHMHLRGKDMKFVAVFPDGREEVLLSTPKYDFGWQHLYELEQPVRIPAGSKLMTVGHYDNSLNNKNNPAPEKEVFWSEQTWDEMFNGMMSYSVDSKDLTKAKPTNQQQ